MGKRYLLYITLIIAFSLFFAGCGGGDSEPSVKCKTDADCTTAVPSKIPYCSSTGRCALKTRPNFCGNQICEPAANENSCTCGADCGYCNSSVTITLNGRNASATYLKKLCNPKNECLVSYDTSVMKSKTYLNEFIGNNFKFNVYTGYDIPFDLKSSYFSIELSTADIDSTKINPPIVIREVRIMEGGTVIARRTALNLEFYDVGDTQNFDLENSQDLDQPEESKSNLYINIDYEYVPLVPGSTQGSYVPGKTERKTYKAAINDKITFIDASLVKK